MSDESQRMVNLGRRVHAAVSGDVDPEAVALRSALAALVAIDPREPSEIDGSLSCHFCHEWYSGLEPRHTEDCPWVRAKALLGEDA